MPISRGQDEAVFLRVLQWLRRVAGVADRDEVWPGRLGDLDDTGGATNDGGGSSPPHLPPPQSAPGVFINVNTNTLPVMAPPGGMIKPHLPPPHLPPPQSAPGGPLGPLPPHLPPPQSAPGGPIGPLPPHLPPPQLGPSGTFLQVNIGTDAASSSAVIAAAGVFQELANGQALVEHWQDDLQPILTLGDPAVDWFFNSGSADFQTPTHANCGVAPAIGFWTRSDRFTNVTVRATIGDNGGARSGASVYARVAVAGGNVSGYEVFNDVAGNQLRLRRWDNGIVTNLTTVLGSAAVGQEIGIRTFANVIYIIKNGVAAQTFNDATYSRGYVGFGLANKNDNFDNFSVTENI